MARSYLENVGIPLPSNIALCFKNRLESISEFNRQVDSLYYKTKQLRRKMNEYKKDLKKSIKKRKRISLRKSIAFDFNEKRKREKSKKEEPSATYVVELQENAPNATNTPKTSEVINDFGVVEAAYNSLAHKALDIYNSLTEDYVKEKLKSSERKNTLKIKEFTELKAKLSEKKPILYEISVFVAQYNNALRKALERLELKEKLRNSVEKVIRKQRERFQEEATIRRKHSLGTKAYTSEVNAKRLKKLSEYRRQKNSF